MLSATLSTKMPFLFEVVDFYFNAAQSPASHWCTCPAPAWLLVAFQALSANISN